MDVCESEKALRKQSAAEKTRLPLVLSENKNGVAHQAQSRDVGCRYKSPTPTSPATPKHSPSPLSSGIPPSSTVSAPKRATSAERKHPTQPSSPRSPSTPVEDTSAEMLLASRKIVGNKSQESLWPSTMRTLDVSFQSDTYSVPISKRGKPASNTLPDHTRRLSSNVVHKQAEVISSRKPMAQRKWSPFRGKSSVDQSDNPKHVDSLNLRLVDQHRWPSRASGKVSTSVNRNTDLTDKIIKTSSVSCSGTGTPSPRRLSLDGISKPLIKSSRDLIMQTSRNESGTISDGGSIDDSSSDRTQLSNSATRSRTIPTRLLRSVSPSLSRGVSLSWIKALNPFSRAPSPVRVRPASPTRQSQSSTSVLSFIEDVTHSKKASNQNEDAHQLRLLYNRHLQWRYANACNDDALQSQKVEAEEMLYSVWMAISELWDSTMLKRIEILRLRIKLKLYLHLNNQISCLDGWDSIEIDHVDSITGVIKDLQARAIRVPVTIGARGDIKTVRAAISSAVHVVQAIGSTVSSILPQLEVINRLVSGLAGVAIQERAMLDECESVLGSTAALLAEEASLRTHLLQTRRDGEASIFGC